MPIVIVRDHGYYTGQVGQHIATFRGENVAGASELWVYSDTTPVVSVWRRSHSPYAAEYAMVDRGLVVIAFTREEEDTIDHAEPGDQDPRQLGWTARELEAAGFHALGDLEAIEEGLLTYWSGTRANIARAWLRRTGRGA